MLGLSYRSLEPVLEQRLSALGELRRSQDATVRAIRRVASRRIGRAWGGASALALALATFVVALSAVPAEYAWEKVAHAWATGLLVAAWGVGLAVAAVAGWVARALVLPRLDAPVALTGDAAADLQRLDAADPVLASAAVATRWERASVALPMAAASLLGPLTLHLMVWLVLARPVTSADELAGFGEWVAISVVLVGHAHLAVLVGSLRWAFSLRGRPTVLITQRLHSHWGLTLLVAVGVSCLPGLVLLAVPPLLVAVTGGALLPVMFTVAARTTIRERMALEMA